MSAVVSQPVTAKLTKASIFMQVVIKPGTENEATVRGLCADLSSLLRGIGFRSATGRLTCVLGVGSEAWDRLFGAPRPAELHPFKEIRGVHHAVSTPADLLFHICAEEMDLCFEMASAIMDRIGDIVTVVDEVHGFKYFDARDLLGFVDGTENPVDQAALDAALIGEEDAAFAGGSYVITQKYLHDMRKWNAMPVEYQEGVVGRKKLSDIELAESAKPSYAHNVLTNIEENGQQLQIVRANMPFGEVGKGEFGTYFIGYARSPSRIERMLNNMFVGVPPGNYDRLLDVSTPVTGSLFFIPTADFLDEVSEDAPAGAAAPADSASPPKPDVNSGSLGIGSLKGEPTRE